MDFKLSTYQENILDVVKTTNKNILVDAKAGSGKTSTLILISEAIQNQGKKCLFLAFNKHIVEELKGKMNTTDCAIKTIHSLGYSYLRSFLYRQHNQNYKLELDEGKLRDIVKVKFEEDGYQQSVIENNTDKTGTDLKDFIRTLISEVCHLINFCRFHMTNYHEQDKVRKLALSCCRTIIEDNIGFDNYPTLVETAIDKLKNDFENPAIVDGVPVYKVDFTDMIYFPVYYRMIPPFSIREYLDYVLVDECQDLSELQQEFLKTLGNNSRFIFVGDEKQAIYGFAGADTKSIFKLTQKYDLEQLPLNICYRCPKKVIQLVQQEVLPTIEYNKERPDIGEIECIERSDIVKKISKDDIIITRRNSDLLRLFIDLAVKRKIQVRLLNNDLVNNVTNNLTRIISSYIEKYNKGLNIEKELFIWMAQQGIPKQVLKQKDLDKDVENKIIELMKKRRDKSITKQKHTVDYLVKCMTEYKTQGNYNEKNMETGELDELTAYYYIIESFIEMFKEKVNALTVKDLISFIEDFLSLNENKEVPTLSTIHKMKGGEADNIFIYDYPRFPYCYSNMSEDDNQQEKNLQYVALTRAKKKLYLVLTVPTERELQSEQGLQKVDEMNERVEMLVDNINSLNTRNNIDNYVVNLNDKFNVDEL